MYNEITRKITSLTLMTIMLAGGMTVAFSGMEPAYAAGELTVSAEAIGNFAGIQVIEIVVDDPDRSDTDATEGRPNVEINSDDVYMAQGTDGAWYAYVANQLSIASSPDATSIYNATDGLALIANSDSDHIYANATNFLDGVKPINTFINNDADAEANWPFIQAYDIADNTQVTITYGTGPSGETVVLTYDYDDSKDISLDRSKYPAGAGIIVSLDDSLLNLSPTADEYWAFNSTDTYWFHDNDATLATAVSITSWAGIGFEEGPLTFDVGTQNVFNIQNSTLHDTITESYPGVEGLIIFSESTTDDNVFVNYAEDDLPNVFTNTDNSVTGGGSMSYNDNHSIILDTFNAAVALVVGIEEWLSGVEIAFSLTDEDKNLNSAIEEDLLILDGEVPYISVGTPIHFGDTTISVSNVTSLTKLTDSELYTIVNNVNTTLTIDGTWPYPTQSDNEYVFSYLNFDLTKLGNAQAKGTLYMGNTNGTIPNDATPSGVTFTTNGTSNTFEVVFSGLTVNATGNAYFDVLSFGQNGAVADLNGDINDNVVRVNDAFYRFQLEESGDNTAKFEGGVEYIMINQLNVFDENTYGDIETADDSLVIIVSDDLDDEDAIRVNYQDIDSTGSDETLSVQEDASTHTGRMSLDKTSYSSGNTITVTLEDVDLNTDSETIEIYTANSLNGWVGDDDVWLVQMLIDDIPFEGCVADPDLSLEGINFSFVETDKGSGIFLGTLKLPLTHCDTDGVIEATNGLDIEFEYQDYSDASGEPNETSSSVSIRSNTGSVSLDRTVYPVPIGPNQFAKHSPAVGSLDAKPVSIVIRVNDPDANKSASGEDSLSTDVLTLEVARGSDKQTIYINSTSMIEITPDSGIFEVDVELDQQIFTELGDGTGGIEQGDIIQIEYKDPADASGDINTVTDSATFDLRNGVVQTDKSVYLIGSDAIITLIDPDLNLDSESAETLSLDLINWDSDAGDINLSDDVFDAEPFGLRETGDDTGIFQVVIEIPREINGDKLERGEPIELEYTDHGPAGANFVGDDDEDITVDIFTSNFGATVELDQKVYTWTDKVYVTIVAPDHNFDDNAIDEIGTDPDAELTISTRGEKIESYKLVETGTDTGIFTGEVILTGFSAHDADGDGVGKDAVGNISADGSGPTNGFLPADNDDGLTVSFEYTDGQTATGSSLIRWNIGEVQWLEASYPATGTGVVRVIDPDMNLNPESVNTFDINVWSDTAAGGISLAITETNEATGIFEGTVFFTVTDSSSGSRLAVAEGDTVTAEYEDNTLPDPYSTADELDITATATIGTIVPPLERAPATHLRAVDAFDNSLDTLSIDQQVQITADLSNGQDRIQEFAYLLQVQNNDGVTVSLSWITGELSPGQTFSPAVSWIPTENGDFTATVFVWQSVNNPTALSPPVSTVLKVNS